MSARETRIEQDLKKIRTLSDRTGGKVILTETKGNPISEIYLELRYITAPSSSYPAAKQDVTKVKIALVSRYPFVEPVATITTPIYHPNVFSGGKICFGTKWLPTENLDLLVKRIIKIITFDPTILNESSPANGNALTWYKMAKSRNPSYFPTDRSTEISEQKPRMTWKNISGE